VSPASPVFSLPWPEYPYEIQFSHWPWDRSRSYLTNFSPKSSPPVFPSALVVFVALFPLVPPPTTHAFFPILEPQRFSFFPELFSDFVILKSLD